MWLGEIKRKGCVLVIIDNIWYDLIHKGCVLDKINVIRGIGCNVNKIGGIRWWSSDINRNRNG